MCSKGVYLISFTEFYNQPDKTMNSKTKKRILIWGLLLIVLTILAIPKISFDDSTARANTFTPQTSVAVDVMVLQPGTASEKIITNGSIMGDEEIELRSEVSGKVVKINFEEGSRVSKGQLLVKINDADLQAQLKRAESLKNLAEEREHRAKQLLDKDLSSQEEYDVILNDLNSRTAEVDLLKAQIEKTEIVAPFNGTVGLRMISEGSLTSSAVVIAKLVKTDPVKIDFAVPQKYFNYIKPGTNISLKLSPNEKTYTAKVYAVEPRIDPITRTLQVRARTGNRSGELIPGAYTEIEIIIDENDNALKIPTEALVPDISGEMVYLYQKGKAVPRPVETGIRTGTDVEITNGVAKGDTVITSAIIQLRPGIDVQIKNL